MRPAFNWISDKQIRAAYHVPSTDSIDIDMENPNEGEEQPLRRAKLIEGTHISTLVFVEWERHWLGSPLNERLMNEMFFRSIANSFMQERCKSLLAVHLYVFDCLPFSINCGLASSLQIQSSVAFQPCHEVCKPSIDGTPQIPTL